MDGLKRLLGLERMCTGSSMRYTNQFTTCVMFMDKWRDAWVTIPLTEMGNHYFREAFQLLEEVMMREIRNRGCSSVGSRYGRRGR